MKNLKLYLVISIVINILLAYIIFKPEPVKGDLESYYKDRIKKENIAHKNRLLVDSIRHEGEISKLNKKINYSNKIRKDERNKYESELSKINHMVNDSSINLYLDSLQGFCCPKRASQ